MKRTFAIINWLAGFSILFFSPVIYSWYFSFLNIPDTFGNGLGILFTMVICVFGSFVSGVELWNSKQ